MSNLDELQKIPKGTIVAWYAKAGPTPMGWAICDGTGPTPDLRGKFIQGVADPADIGQSGGRTSHTHTVTKEPDQRNRDDFEGEGGECMLGGADEQNHLPPFFTLIYLMKV